MARSALDSAAAKSLLRHIKNGSTGRLSVGAGASQIVLYLRDGNILAAEAVDDTAQIVRRLIMLHALAPERATELEDIADQGEPVLGVLLDEMSDDLMSRILEERFQANICQFLGSISKAKFKVLSFFFVENIQIGHDSAELVKRCGDLWDRAYTLHLDAEVIHGEPSDAQDISLLQRLITTPRTVSSLLLRAPLEPVMARALMAEMLQDGQARFPDEPLHDDITEVAPIPPQVAEPADDTEADDTEADDTEPSSASSAVESATAEDVSDPDSEDIDDPDSIHEEDLNDEERALLARLEAEFEAHNNEVDDPLDNSKDEDEDEDVDDPPSFEAQGAGDLSSLDAWLSAATAVEDAELDAFEDHDWDRSSTQDGAFSTINVDKVDVSTTPSAPTLEPEEVIEAAEAPSARYGAPVLSEDNALEKIEVVQDVLRKLVQAFDAAEGSGRGRAVVQLLVDGSPSRYTPLLEGLVVSDDGEIPADDMLDNLHARPAPEHRRLLGQTLLNLIDRALSAAAEQLPGDAFDDLYASVLGYRKRLGL